MITRDRLLSRAIDDVVGSAGVLAGLRGAVDLAATFAGAPAGAWVGPLQRVVDGTDHVAAIAALHAVAGLSGTDADLLLERGLDDDRPFVVQHAAWALSARSPRPSAMVPLAGIVAGLGGFTGMLAQRTLEGWAEGDPDRVGAALTAVLVDAGDDAARARLVETLGLVPGPARVAELARIATDTAEGPATRVAAAAALGDRPGDPAPLRALLGSDERLAVTAVLALHDRQRRAAPLERPLRPGLRIGQVFVHTDFGAGDRSGTGDHGGIATLLELLGGELAALDDVADVVSIGRGTPEDALLIGWPWSSPGAGGASIPFGPDGGTDMRQAWPHRVAIERGMRRVLRGLPGLDVLHLRMADVGTLAAARVARRAGLPTVFTAAPDPHGVLEAAESTGQLTRADFGPSDLAEHWWFRARMVERLSAQAAHVVLLPRPDVRREMSRLLGVDDLDGRSSVVPEGVHLATVQAARADVATRPRDELGPAVRDLFAALARMPRRRRRLPLLISVGRLHPVKGMERVVEAWRQGSSGDVNLVIVGGDLDAPSPVEAAVLADIAERAGERDGLVLLGHRSHREVATLLEVAAGHATPALPCGVYVAGSAKEEFGLAIVEALAAGLPVVAPAAGGPATYVRDGVDGVLVAEPTADALATAIGRCLALAPVPGRAAAASTRVAAELTIEAMAIALRDVYRDLVALGTGA